MNNRKNTTILFSIYLALFSVSINAAEPLPRDQQEELVNYYKFVTQGKSGLSGEAQSLIGLDSVQLPLKCATPIVTSYVMNFNRLDKDLVDRHSLSLWVRPTGLNESYDSPGGLFKIHFTRTGTSAVYQPTVTTGGVPNYVISVARIFDSVYFHIIDTLGFPKPPSDGGYSSGVDSLYDIYVRNLGGNYFGLTYPDSLFFSGPFSLDATSFIEIDNDYQEGSFGQYNSQPLNAVRVTAAHEYFHGVQFGIDLSEAEDYTDSVLQRRYWYEMSAVWMEEEIYDNINDYYSVLPFFFNRPRSSIQQFASFFDFHPYASAVFPIFLTEKFGRDIIKPIWIRCGTLGLGPHFLEATQLVIDSVVSNRCAADSTDPLCDTTLNFRSLFGEFTLWNYFTGTRANLTPPGVPGYSERANYPAIPDTAFIQVYQYPSGIFGNANPKSPSVNSATYLRLNNLRGIFYVDSTDTFTNVELRFGTNKTDSLLPQGWHIHRLGQFDIDTTLYIDTSFFFPDNSTPVRRLYNPRNYRSVTYVVAPASWKWQAYTSTNYDTDFGYYVYDSLSLLPNKPTVIFAPYPNPADVRSMNEENLKFKFQIATDAQAFQLYVNPYTVIDFFTSAGELVRTFENNTPAALIDPISGTIRYELEWDMRTASGENVAPGVYVCLVRMFTSNEREELLAEEKTKVLIVR